MGPFAGSMLFEGLRKLFLNAMEDACAVSVFWVFDSKGIH